jgi:hypothetical protein
LNGSEQKKAFQEVRDFKRICELACEFKDMNGSLEASNGFNFEAKMPLAPFGGI